MNKLLKSFTLVATFLSSLSIGISPLKASTNKTEVETPEISVEVENKDNSRDEFPGRRQGGGTHAKGDRDKFPGRRQGQGGGP